MDVLHSIRSLLCTEINTTPHERIFQYSRRSTTGHSLPTWLLSPGPVYLKRNVRASKYDPLLGNSVDLLDANPHYAHVRLRNGRETTVSLRQFLLEKLMFYRISTITSKIMSKLLKQNLQSHQMEVKQMIQAMKSLRLKIMCIKLNPWKLKLFHL